MYQWIEHTAELGAAARPEPRRRRRALRTRREPPRTIAIEAADAETLLADWLSELAFLAETQDFVPDDVRELEVAERSLRAVVRGHVGRPAPLVKAVTYHGLELREEAGGVRARIVLDV